MTLLTQKKVVIIFAAQVGWGIYLQSGLLPHAHWVDVVTVSFNSATAVLAFLGFSRTPNGNVLPPHIINQVDRQAVVAKATDTVVQKLADDVTAKAEESSTDKKE